MFWFELVSFSVCFSTVLRTARLASQVSLTTAVRLKSVVSATFSKLSLISGNALACLSLNLNYSQIFAEVCRENKNVKTMPDWEKFVSSGSPLPIVKIVPVKLSVAIDL